MSWTDLTDPGPGPAAPPAVPLRYRILAALAYAATESRRVGDTAPRRRLGRRLPPGRRRVSRLVRPNHRPGRRDELMAYYMTAETMPDPWPDQEWDDELADGWGPPATVRDSTGGNR